MSPSDLEVLIHCHCSPEPHPRLHAPAVKEGIEKFKRDGILDADNRTTPFGAAFLRAILRTPYPKMVYTDESGRPL